MELFQGRIVKSQYIRYIKPVKRFQKITVSTRFLYWDDKSFYIKHEYLRQNKLMAIAYVQVNWMKGRKTVPPSVVIKDQPGFHDQSPSMPSEIGKWLEFEKALKN